MSAAAPSADAAAVVEIEQVGQLRGELVDGVLERELAAVAHPVRE